MSLYADLFPYRANPIKRIAAYLIDALAIVVLHQLFYWAVGDATLGDIDLRALSFFGLNWFLIGALYWSWEGLTGKALGKHLLKLEITDRSAEAASTGQLFLRSFLKNIFVFIMLGVYAVGLLGGAALVWVLFLLGLLFWVIFAAGYFFMLADSKLALHDRITKTAVYPSSVLEGLPQELDEEQWV